MTNVTASAPPPPGNIENARSALDAARRMRSEWLITINTQQASPYELLLHAATLNGRPLRRLKLRRIIGAQPGAGDNTARKILKSVLAMCNTTGEDLDSLTVGWLLDSRAGAKRQRAWCAAMNMGDDKPWLGYPHQHSSTSARS